VEVPDFLTRYDPDPLRFYLTATAPETRDTDFSWEDFVERNNNELVATARLSSRRSLGPQSVANRMLSFAYKRFDGVVPEPGDPSSSSGLGLDDEDQALLEKVETGFEAVGDLYNACKFRAVLGEALAPATHPLGGGPRGQRLPRPEGGSDDGVRHAERAGCGQSEDDPGADALRAAHGAAVARVPSYASCQRRLQRAARGWAPSALLAGHPQGMRS
jgi:hypothetical protein